MTTAAAHALGGLGRRDAAVEALLARTLRHAYATFPSHRSRLSAAGLAADDLRDDGAFACLSRIPIMDADELAALSLESLTRVGGIIDMETSSGTTGARKKRYISREDDIADHAFMAALFRVAGVSERDRAACLDTDPVYLMASFARALDELGAAESYVYSVGRAGARTFETLRRLAPTALFVVPSMLELHWDEFRRAFGEREGRALERVIFLGERTPARLREALTTQLGVEVFSYYGAAETSSLGIECGAHAGIHLFDDRNLFELQGSALDESDGRLVVTSLALRTAPLLRYALGDEVAVRAGDCDCGLPYPRVDVLGRSGDIFSILGSKFQYDSILRSAYRGFDELGYLQLALASGERETLTLRMPDDMRRHQKRLLRSILSEQLELDFLVTSGLVELRFEYVPEARFTESRKMKLVDDSRMRGTV